MSTQPLLMVGVGKTPTSHFQRAGYIGRSVDALCLLIISSLHLSSSLQAVSPSFSLTAPFSPSFVSREAESRCRCVQTPHYLLCLVLCSATQAALLRCPEAVAGAAAISVTTKRRWEGDGTRDGRVMGHAYVFRPLGICPGRSLTACCPMQAPESSFSRSAKSLWLWVNILSLILSQGCGSLFTQTTTALCIRAH